MNPCIKCDRREVGCRKGCYDRLQYILFDKPTCKQNKEPYRALVSELDKRHYKREQWKRMQYIEMDLWN